jgi:transcriptional regulator with XRE-family HTH domain
MASTHHEDYQLLVSMLRETRERDGVPQTELAMRLGTTQTFISKVERGERRLDVVELIEVFEALGVKPDAWITDYLVKRKAIHVKQEVKRKTPTFGRDRSAK